MAAGCLAISASAAPSDRWTLPIATRKLDNGLTVVVSEDHSSPTVGIGMVYKVGIRTEPRGRTGFAHLFEHLMFEGTPNAPHGVFDRVTADGGGDNNGSTHPDYTSYIERAPVSALEPLLWLEADRMKTLEFDQDSLDGQRDVVKEEIRVNVLNQPYGGFSETDLPQLAFQKWENGHDGYGSFDDLDKAKLDDVRVFHRDFYGPNNAVLGIAGDVTPEQGFALAQKYFGAIPARATPPRPDVDEPLNTAEKRKREGDGLAKLPALAVGWKMPPRGSADQAAMIVLGELLAGSGDASRLHQALVKGSALAVQLGDFTGSGSPWEYDGPTLYTVVVIHKVEAKPDDVLAVIDAQVDRIAREGVDPASLQGVKTRLLADWYDDLEPFVDRAERLAILQAVWGDAGIANRVPELIDAVTPADLQRVATTYLTHANRSIIERVPDFMLADRDPARSDRQPKPKPAPAKPAGKVVVGGLQSVKPPAPTAEAPAAPASAPAAISPPPAPPPAASPATTSPQQQGGTSPAQGAAIPLAPAAQAKPSAAGAAPATEPMMPPTRITTSAAGPASNPAKAAVSPAEPATPPATPAKEQARTVNPSTKPAKTAGESAKSRAADAPSGSPGKPRPAVATKPAADAEKNANPASHEPAKPVDVKQGGTASGEASSSASSTSDDAGGKH